MATADRRGLGYLGLVNTERLVAEFMDLVQVDSQTGDERLMADALRPRLAALGAARLVEDSAGATLSGTGEGTAGNLIAWFDGTAPGPTVLLSAHMDRVAPGRGIRPARVDGRVVSDGTTILAADDVAGLAAILEAIRCLQEASLDRVPVVVTFTIAEEGGLRGAKALDARALGAHMGFVFDASGANGTVVVGAPHQVRIDVKVHGIAAHAGISPEKGVSAVMVAAQALAKLRMGRVDDLTTSNFGTFEAGTSTNVVADLAVLRGEARSHDRARLDSHVADVREAFESAVAATPGSSLEFVVEEAYPGFSAARDTGAAKHAAHCIEHGLSLTPTFGLTGGGSDANVLHAKGIPCVALGTGFENVHSTRESITVEELRRGAALAMALVHEAVGLQV